MQLLNTILGERFKVFAAKRPLSVMMRGMFERAFNPDRVDELFEKVAERQYTRDLRFSTVVDLMLKVVFDISPSIGAAYESSEEPIGVSAVSVYGKLNGVEPAVAAALVHDSVERFQGVVEQMGSTLTPLLPGYRVRIIDGNHLSATERRLKEQRRIAAAPLPGKTLVVLDAQVKLATHVIACEDGHAQERSVFDEILPLVEAKDLWIADRNFCTTGLLFAIATRGGYFLIRHHGSLIAETASAAEYKGECDGGSVYEQRVIVTERETAEQMEVRRITVRLKKATRDGDRELHLLSSIAAEDASAVELAELYRKRWKIETLFQELTTTLKCEIKTLGYPRAAILGFCLALVAYNAVSVVMAALRDIHGEEKIEKEVSGYYINLEFRAVYDGMMLILPSPEWKIFQTMTAAELLRTLRMLAENVQLRKYKKHRRGPKKPQPKRVDIGSPHVSTARLLAERKKK